MNRLFVSFAFGPEFGPKRFSKFGPNLTPIARLDLQLRVGNFIKIKIVLLPILDRTRPRTRLGGVREGMV